MLRVNPRLHRLRSESGQAIVEFALVLPILLLLCFGIFQFAQAMNWWNDLNQIAGTVARQAAVNKADSLTAVRGTADAAPLRTSMTVCYVFPDGNRNAGSAVTVKTGGTFTLLRFLGMGASKNLAGQATMRLEQNFTQAVTTC